mgnify:CR=1 FL=1
MKNVTDLFLLRLQEMIDARLDVIGLGQVEDFAQYKYVAGQNTGLCLARDLMKDLLKDQYEDD